MEEEISNTTQVPQPFYEDDVFIEIPDSEIQNTYRTAA